MKKVLKKIIASVMVCVTIFSLASCGFNYETPEWLEKQICDHVYDEEEMISSATCTEKGKKLKVCSSCGDTKIVTIKPAHDYKLIQVDGYEEVYVCSLCGNRVAIEGTECFHADINLRVEGGEDGPPSPHPICQTCGLELSETEPFTPVSQGDRLCGWYLVEKEQDFIGVFCSFDIPRIGIKDYGRAEPIWLTNSSFSVVLSVDEILSEIKYTPPTGIFLKEVIEYEESAINFYPGNANAILVYIPPQGLTTSYRLENEDGETVGSMAFTFTNFRYNGGYSCTLKKMNFSKNQNS